MSFVLCPFALVVYVGGLAAGGHSVICFGQIYGTATVRAVSFNLPKRGPQDNPRKWHWANGMEKDRPVENRGRRTQVAELNLAASAYKSSSCRSCLVVPSRDNTELA